MDDHHQVARFLYSSKNVRFEGQKERSKILVSR